MQEVWAPTKAVHKYIRKIRWKEEILIANHSKIFNAWIFLPREELRIDFKLLGEWSIDVVVVDVRYIKV